MYWYRAVCCDVVLCVVVVGVCVCVWTDDMILACLSGNQTTGWYIKILAAVPYGSQNQCSVAFISVLYGLSTRNTE
jgi:hypothetical protein